MPEPMRIDEKWIRARLPEEPADEKIDCFQGMYLNGLTVMHGDERGGEEIELYQARNREDLSVV